MGRPRKKMSDKPITPELHTEYQEFVRFTAFPTVLRVKEFGFKSDTDFSKKHGVNQDTLSKWRGRTQFWNDVAAQLKFWGKGQTVDVLMGLFKKAVREGGAPEAKLWMQIFEDFKEKNESTLVANRETLMGIQNATRLLLDQEKKKATKE